MEQSSFSSFSSSLSTLSSCLSSCAYLSSFSIFFVFLSNIIIPFACVQFWKLREIFHTVAKMFIIHTASEWLYWRKHRYLEFQQSKHRFSSNIALHILPWLHCGCHKQSDLTVFSKTHLYLPHLHHACAPSILFEYEPERSCISNPIQADHLGYVGSHYNAPKNTHQIL